MKHDLEWNQRSDKEEEEKVYTEKIEISQIQTHWCQQVFWGSASVKGNKTKEETDCV